MEVLVEKGAGIGEGPHWLEDSNELLWVDISGSKVNLFDCTSCKNVSYSLPSAAAVTLAVPTASNPNVFVISLEKKLSLFDRRSGEAAKAFLEVEADNPNNRINDGKCDSSGRLWFGTMAKEPTPGKGTPNLTLYPNCGSLYSYSPKAGLQTFCKDVTISNGLEWSHDEKTMYYIDSVPKNVYTFDYDAGSGSVSNQKVWVNLEDINVEGFPDGMTKDTDGNLWVASYCGACVLKLSPKGDVLSTLKFPAKRITSCCFGGPNYETLFVTSASTDAPQDELTAFPNSGGLFAVTNTGSRGQKAASFDDCNLPV